MRTENVDIDKRETKVLQRRTSSIAPLLRFIIQVSILTYLLTYLFTYYQLTNKKNSLSTKHVSVTGSSRTDGQTNCGIIQRVCTTGHVSRGETFLFFPLFTNVAQKRNKKQTSSKLC